MAQPADIFEIYPHLRDIREEMDYDFSRCWTFRNPKEHISQEDVAAALIIYRGNISLVAHALGRSRRVIQSFINQVIQLRDLWQDINDEFLDHVEDSYKQDALAGDMQAKKFFLTTLGKDRGYVTRSESTGKDGEKLMEPPTISTDDIKSINSEDLERLLQLRDRPSEKGDAA